MEVEYVYDADGRITQIKRDGNAIAIYTYDAAGRRATRALANGLTTSYTYDAAGQLLSVAVDNQTPATVLEHSYTYDNVGQRETRTERLGPLGPWTDEYSYDNAGQLTGVDYGAAHPYAGPGGGNLNLASYDFDNALPRERHRCNGLRRRRPHPAWPERSEGNVGNRETETRNAVPTAYVADNVNRYCPPSQTRDDLRDGFASNEPLNAAKQSTVGGVAQTHNRATEEGARSPAPLGRLPGGRDMHGPACLGNARGDLLHHNDFTLLYDADGHLISATRAAPATQEYYRYDPMGRRAGVASPTGGGAPVLEYHLHFGIHVIDAHQPVSGLTEQYIFEPSARIGSEIASPAWGAARRAQDEMTFILRQPGIDQPLAAVSPGTGSIRFFHQDALGSVVALTDATGAPIELYRYCPRSQTRDDQRDGFAPNEPLIAAKLSAWGQPVVYNGGGTLQADGTQPQSRFMFTGREWNALTGLSHHRARQYSPSLGRWTGPDPIGEAGGWNLYAYVGNGATRWVDFTGHDIYVVERDIVIDDWKDRAASLFSGHRDFVVELPEGALCYITANRGGGVVHHDPEGERGPAAEKLEEGGKYTKLRTIPATPEEGASVARIFRETYFGADYNYEGIFNDCRHVEKRIHRILRYLRDSRKPDGMTYKNWVGWRIRENYYTEFPPGAP